MTGGQEAGDILTGAASLPHRLPLFPLSGVLLLPGTTLPLNIFEPRYLAMVTDALAGDRVIAMIQPADPKSRDYEPALYSIGCVGRITDHRGTADGRMLITLFGLGRFEVGRELERTTAYRQAIVDYRPYAADLEPAGSEEDGIQRHSLLDLATRYFTAMGLDPEWQGVEEVSSRTLVNSLSAVCPFEPNEKQALLESVTTVRRSEVLMALLEMALNETVSESGIPVH